jgi:hypothetical protein
MIIRINAEKQQLGIKDINQDGSTTQGSQVSRTPQEAQKSMPLLQVPSASGPNPEMLDLGLEGATCHCLLSSDGTSNYKCPPRTWNTRRSFSLPLRRALTRWFVTGVEVYFFKVIKNVFRETSASIKPNVK